jgi:hypothetical protein
MLALSTVLEIDRLLHEGTLSQRQIAVRLGVSRGTVGAIASGRRALVGNESPPHGTPTASSQARPERCPRCGHRVRVPCMVCLARHYRHLRKRPPSDSIADRPRHATRMGRT